MIRWLCFYCIPLEEEEEEEQRALRWREWGGGLLIWNLCPQLEFLCSLRHTGLLLWRGVVRLPACSVLCWLTDSVNVISLHVLTLRSSSADGQLWAVTLTGSIPAEQTHSVWQESSRDQNKLKSESSLKPVNPTESSQLRNQRWGLGWSLRVSFRGCTGVWGGCQAVARELQCGC